MVVVILGDLKLASYSICKKILKYTESRGNGKCTTWASPCQANKDVLACHVNILIWAMPSTKFSHKLYLLISWLFWSLARLVYQENVSLKKKVLKTDINIFKSGCSEWFILRWNKFKKVKPTILTAICYICPVCYIMCYVWLYWSLSLASH